MILFDALYNLAFILQDFVRSTATSGSQTTLYDTVARFEPDDYFTNGTLFLLSGNNADNAVVITDWDQAASKFTFANLGTLCATGDIYAAIPKDFPKGLMVECINQALKGIDLPKTDATLTTVTNQEEYTLPDGVYNVKRVEIAHSLVEPYQYSRHVNWEEREGLLVFDTDYEPKVDDYLIRLSYNVKPDAVNDDDDTIDDLILSDYLTWKAAVHALRWRMIRNPEEVGARINEAMAQEARYARLMPTKFVKDPKFSRWY